MRRLNVRITHRIAVALLLITQGSLLAYSATRHSPTHLEPAILASGISHWRFGRFELYRVNPPLVRMIAALPVIAIGCETDWTRFQVGLYSRPEFPVGEDFVRANGPASIPLFFYARWACIPFNLVGAYFAYRWAMEIYRSVAAGFATLLLYVFEPNLLAHGELITSDGACTAFGILAGYTFWRWLKCPTWTSALFAGGALGFAELSKMSWLFLFGLWPLLWIIWSLLQPKNADSRDLKVNSQKFGSSALSVFSTPQSRRSAVQLSAILVFAVYVINLGYFFDGFGTPIKDFEFVSTTFTGLEKAGTPGNRFAATWLSELPVPLPKQFVLGFDTQYKDLEAFVQKSYLRGEWRQNGWWYYYLYGLVVKVPCGTWGLFTLAIITRLAVLTRNYLANFPSATRRRHSLSPSSNEERMEVSIPISAINDPGWKVNANPSLPPLRDEIILLAPAIVLLIIVSSHTAFNIHLRYVFPSLALFLIYIGQVGSRLAQGLSMGSVLVGTLIGYSLVSALLIYPHHLTYFNDFVGGPNKGWKHLLGSSFDWGQDLLYIPSYEKKTGYNITTLTNGYHLHETYYKQMLRLQNRSNHPSVSIISPNALVDGSSSSRVVGQISTTLWVFDDQRDVDRQYFKRDSGNSRVSTP